MPGEHQPFPAEPADETGSGVRVPARLQVLRAAGLDPDVVVSGVDETDVTGTPREIATTLAMRKASAVAAELIGTLSDWALIIGCDSVLDVDGQAYGKPMDAAQARERWLRMRGSKANLLTGHHVIRTDTGQSTTDVAATEVHFGHPSDDEIDAYIESGEPLHVAGSFTIDGRGGWFVERIEGDHTNVVGISLPLLRRMLITLDVDLPSLWREAGGSAHKPGGNP